MLLLAGALLVGALAGCINDNGDDSAQGDQSSGPTEGTYAVDKICFSTSVPRLSESSAMPLAGTMKGTRYLPPDAKVAILLLHGSVLPSGVWNGGFGGPSLADELAAAGYAVFLPDRLGFGESPWTGDERNGAQLTIDAAVDNSHDVVQALRTGTYDVAGPEGSCSEAAPNGRAFDHVVYGGHSYGAAMTVFYGAMYDDVDALFPFMFYTTPFGQKVFAHFATCRTVPPTADGYMQLFCKPGEDVSPCAGFMFHTEGADPVDIENGCAAATSGRDPLDLSSGTWGDRMKEAMQSIPSGLPVLRAAAEFDDIWEDGTGSAAREQDLATWKANCTCTVTDFVQEGSGHIWWLHHSAPTVAPALVAWLETSGLGAFEPSSP